MTRSVFPVSEALLVHRHENRDHDQAFSSYDITYEEEAMIEPDPLSVLPYEPPPWAFNRRAGRSESGRQVRGLVVASEVEADRLVAEMRRGNRRVVQAQSTITVDEPEEDE